jgi:glutamate racemase
MIGIFDSGFGGLQTLKYFHETYPEYDYIFLADQAHYPFGTKKPEQIQQYTFDALNRLFDQWATIVIIACNTAAAYAIKQRQANYPEKKTLSITIPGMEKINEVHQQCKHITVLATEWTMKSGMYTRLFESINPNPWTSMNVVVATDLVDLVEQGITDETERKQVLDKYLLSLKKQKTDCLVLGCTHFPVLTESIKQYFDGDIVDPGKEAVERFWPYLERHPEIADAITKNGQIHLYTTGNPDKFLSIGKNIIPSIQEAKHITL